MSRDTGHAVCGPSGVEDLPMLLLDDEAGDPRKPAAHVPISITQLCFFCSFCKQRNTRKKLRCKVASGRLRRQAANTKGGLGLHLPRRPTTRLPAHAMRLTQSVSHPHPRRAPGTKRALDTITRVAWSPLALALGTAHLLLPRIRVRVLFFGRAPTQARHRRRRRER